MDAIFYKQLCEEEKRLEGLLEAVRLLKQNISGNTSGPNASSVTIKTSSVNRGTSPDKKYFDAFSKHISKFDENLTQIEKVVFALNAIKSGIKDDVADYILKLDKSKSKEIVVQYCGNVCSKLFNLGLINATYNGKNNIYSIKK